MKTFEECKQEAGEKLGINYIRDIEDAIDLLHEAAEIYAKDQWNEAIFWAADNADIEFRKGMFWHVDEKSILKGLK